MGRAFIGNFKGPPGDEGKQGKQGIQGPMGPAGPTGAVDGNTPIEFTEAEALANIESGESISTIFGKTKKILGSLLIGAGSTLLGNNLTANQALVSDASGKVNVSGISATELGYLSGITKNIQTQFSEQNEKLNGKVSSGSAANLGAIELSSGTPWIDFHYGNSTNDFTSRIIEYAEGQLRLQADLFNVQALLRMNGQNVATESYVDDKIITGSKVITVEAGTEWAYLFDNFITQYGNSAVAATNGDYIVCPVEIISTNVQDDKLWIRFSRAVEITGNMRVNYAIFKPTLAN